MTSNTGERYYEAELYRLKGELPVRHRRLAAGKKDCWMR
ncbi:protein of unknown function (plasmid) [Cupriavidus neocaledonicus]|nr:protein of unknown function [Cupriavidus neocaledonicus]